VKRNRYRGDSRQHDVASRWSAVVGITAGGPLGPSSVSSAAVRHIVDRDGCALLRKADGHRDRCRRKLLPIKANFLSALEVILASLPSRLSVKPANAGSHPQLKRWHINGTYITDIYHPELYRAIFSLWWKMDASPLSGRLALRRCQRYEIKLFEGDFSFFYETSFGRSIRP
jgi:hypothetical protein